MFATPVLPREAEVDEIVGLLSRRDVRLVTLVGPPGAGKTRLALMVAELFGREFLHGSQFVDLVPITDPAQVVPTIASALGVRDMGNRSVAASLTAVLRDKRMLLVIDNLEHVLNAAMDLVAILEGAPRVKMLVTSRAALGVPPEQQYLVHPLALPTHHDEADPRHLIQVPSVALLDMRARAVKHDWRISTTSAPVVAQLCRDLDGLPLALELAAGWMNVLAPHAVQSRLKEFLELPGPAAGRPARHRTLGTAIAWSYDLLSQPEQAVFRQVSIFVGGWTLSGAAAVCQLTTAELLERLRGLVDKHLVYSAEQEDGEPRFGMLVTIRAYASGRLVESGQAEATAQRRQVLPGPCRGRRAATNRPTPA
jgi:predicted ATPase